MLSLTHTSLTVCLAMAKARSCRPVTMEPWVLSKARSKFYARMVLGQVSLQQISVSSLSLFPPTLHSHITHLWATLYESSDTSANEDNSFRNHIR